MQMVFIKREVVELTRAGRWAAETPGGLTCSVCQLDHKWGPIIGAPGLINRSWQLADPSRGLRQPEIRPRFIDLAFLPANGPKALDDSLHFKSRNDSVSDTKRCPFSLKFLPRHSSSFFLDDVPTQILQFIITLTTFKTSYFFY